MMGGDKFVRHWEWILDPRKWVGEGIVDCKFESDAFCCVNILISPFNLVLYILALFVSRERDGLVWCVYHNYFSSSKVLFNLCLLIEERDW